MTAEQIYDTAYLRLFPVGTKFEQLTASDIEHLNAEVAAIQAEDEQAHERELYAFLDAALPTQE